MSQLSCRGCGEVNAGPGPTCRVCGAPLSASSEDARPSRLARSRAERSGTKGDRVVDAGMAAEAARRSLDFAIYGLVGFGLIFGALAVLKGYNAKTVLARHGSDRALISKANWAICLGIFDMLVAPGLGFLLIGGLIYLWIT